MSAPLDNAKTAIPEATLHILSRDGVVIERDITQAEIRIGKGPQNDIILGDASVSGTHAMISFDEGKYTLSDLGSRNGTLLNDVRLAEPRVLQHGDLIKMGHCTITFRLKEAETTLSIPRTQMLETGPPPPPPAPPAPKTPALTEDSLAAALISAGLVAKGEIDRVRGADARGRRLCRALIEERLATEIGLRDLLNRTFNIAPVELKTMEIDAASATALRAQFLRDRWVCPIISQQPDKLMLSVADPTDKETIEEAERITRKKASIRLATPTEIKAQLDAFFTPRLVGVLQSTGEKIEAILNQPEFEIGKAPHNRLVLNDATVSSTHAIVIARSGGFNIADLGSSNGTFINGRQLGNDAYTLQHGDKIQLGQVLLTFRNPAETTENKTAKLSLEALEEIRKRAMTRTLQAPTGARTDPTAWAAAPPVVVAAAPAQVIVQQAAADAEEKSEKKKKKLEKEKEKNSWFSANSLSRILAQVLGALVSLGGTLYIATTFSRQNAEPAKGGGGGAASSSLLPSTAWQGFKTGFLGIGGELIEASGAHAVSGASGVLVVSDNRTSEVLWMALDEQGAQSGSLKAVPLGVTFKDPESITFGNGLYYLVTSQSDPKDGAENAIVRFGFDSQTQTANHVEIINDLRTFLLANITDPTLKVAGEPSGIKGGLNIEGIAWDPNEARLLLGLRSPQLGKSAALLPVKLRDPQGPFTTANLLIEAPIYLSLGGQGVRDITYDTKLKNFLIVSGAPETQPKSDFALWEWNGADTSPTKLMTLDEDFKPEGITSFKFNDRNFIFVVGDAGSYLKLDYAGPK
ncbi:MAG: DUF3616 domain-containing protein [Blastocatellia bacterium]|nr:DUF3616 domain-containing protein [Blastocatellia bacterium]